MITNETSDWFFTRKLPRTLLQVTKEKNICVQHKFLAEAEKKQIELVNYLAQEAAWRLWRSATDFVRVFHN